MRFKSVLVIVGVLALAGYFGYTKLHNAKNASAAKTASQSVTSVEAVRVRAGELTIALDTVGTLKANEALMLKPEITGRIDTIHFPEGASAKKGELLVNIDARVFEAEVKQAEAALNLARVTYSRAKLLKEKGAGTVSNYDTAAANLNVAQAQLDLARAQLDKTRIIAPFNGIMGLRHVSPGDYVNPGQDIATFQSLNPMKAEFTLPETAMRTVASGQSINVKIDALPDRNFTGTVYAIDPQIDEMSRNITLRALIPNDDNVLQPGLFARVSIITAHKDNALFVPESAIVPRGNNMFVMKIGDANKVQSVQVTLGERKNGEVEIVSGVNEGDLVVTAGLQKIRDGQEVNYTLPQGQTPQGATP